MILDGIDTGPHDWYLIEMKDNTLVYTNMSHKETYKNRSESLFNVYTLTLFFTTDFIKKPDGAVITVHSSRHAVEQEIQRFYYNDLENLKRQLESFHLPYAYLGV